MSYILDALKKSEHERQQNQSPTVHSIHASSRLMIERKSSFSGKWILVLSILVIVGGFIAFNVNNSSPLSSLANIWPSKNNNSSSVNALKLPAVKPIAEEKTIKKAVPVVSTSVTKSTADTASNTDVVAKESVAINEDDLPVMQLVELPDAIRSSLPAMTYSFHVFSSDQAKRTIIINNHRFREGEQVGNNWTLDGITETGIVLKQGRYRAAIDVVESW